MHRIEFLIELLLMVYNHEKMENENQKNKLPELYQFIIEGVDPEKIFRLVDHTGKPSKSGYADIMITMPDMPAKNALEINIATRLASLKYDNLSATICQTEYMDRMIREGNIYFNVAINNDSLVYNKNGWKKPEMNIGLKAQKKETANQLFYSGFRKAQAFYTSAKLHQENNIEVSAFMLHQATELCLYTLTKALTERDKCTPDLQELLISSLRYNEKLPLILTDAGKEDERLLQLLDDANYAYRYKNDSVIAANDLKILMEKVDRLQEATEQTFLGWIKRYEML